MRSYSAPQLVSIGSVVEKTQGAFVAQDDPNGKEIRLPAGSVGFGL